MHFPMNSMHFPNDVYGESNRATCENISSFPSPSTWGETGNEVTVIILLYLLG